jgi:hypothetical protein
MSDAPIELEEATGLEPVSDRRPRMAEPLPVKLVSIEDVRLPALAGVEVELDRFYVGLLEFARDDSMAGAGELVYRADNFAIRFVIQELLPRRGEYRPTQIEVQSLLVAEHKLIEGKIEYTRQKTLTPGEESLVLLDPAGNWVELVELRAIH